MSIDQRNSGDTPRERIGNFPKMMDYFLAIPKPKEFFLLLLRPPPGSIIMQRAKTKTFRKRQGFEGQRLIVLPKKVMSDFLTRDPVTRQIYITDIGYYP